ncbi:MAG: aminoacyl-tRNA hydrolase [Candidatus Omnitrophota bacterium]
MKFVIGIGNPGRQYEKTRHNIGFRTVDGLMRIWSQTPGQAVRWRIDRGLSAEVAEFSHAVLLKPQTFVNLTGTTIAGLLRQGRGIAELLVICDDANLEFGQMRIRPSGSAGGHHGLESAIEAAGSEEFARLRIGVGNESMGRDLAQFVLGEFDGREQKAMPLIVDRAVAACDAWISNGYKAAADYLSRQGLIQKGE